jgi:hypothetical protein
LADKGLIEWSDKRIWKALYRVGGGVHFYESDAFNSSVLSSKLQRACTRLWDEDEYRELDRANRGNIDSKVEEYKKEAMTNLDRINEQIEQMLYDKCVNKVWVDPHRYESFIRTIEEAGKGSPTDFFFYVIMGVSEGLIHPDRAVDINSNRLNNYPGMEKIYEEKPTLETYKEWRNDILGGHSSLDSYYKKMGNVSPPGDFDDWFFRNVSEADKVKERALANANGEQWDHDHARMIAAVGDSSMARNILATATGGNSRVKPTMYQNILVGMLKHGTSIARQSDLFSRDELKQIIARQTGYFAIFSGFYENRLEKGASGDERKYRASKYDLDGVPREAYGYNSEWNTRKYIEELKKLYGECFPPDVREYYQVLYDPANKNPEALKQKLEPMINQKFSHIKREKNSDQIPTEPYEFYDFGEKIVAYYLEEDSNADEYLDKFLQKAKNLAYNHHPEFKKEDEKKKERLFDTLQGDGMEE